MQITIWLNSPEVPQFTFQERNLTLLKSLLPGTVIIPCATEKEFVEQLPRTTIAIVWVFRQEWFVLAPRLAWLATPAAGKDFFTVTPPTGLFMSNGTFHGKIMAETVAGMILAQCRGILAAARLQPTHSWPRRELSRLMRSLHGARVTILGFGQIGRYIGGLLKPFGVHLTGIKRTVSPPPEYFDSEDFILPLDALEGVLPGTDHMVVVLPRSPQTDDILDAGRLGLLPPHAYLYNVGRGNAVDENALVSAIREKKLAGACLDVFKQEPLAEDSPLRSCPEILLMPHASAIADDYLDLFFEEFSGLLRQRYQLD